MQATTALNSSAGQFVDKTDLTPGTKWTATDANAWQAELLEIITEAGLTPSGGDLTQVRQAIQILAKLVKVDAATEADVLANPRTIGGVSFDGSANINLPGVNTAGNQNTSGTSANSSLLEGLSLATIRQPSLTVFGALTGTQLNNALLAIFTSDGISRFSSGAIELGSDVVPIAYIERISGHINIWLAKSGNPPWYLHPASNPDTTFICKFSVL